MTEQLKTLMHAQADSVDFAAPDLDAMVRTGDRRRRTRRLGVAGAVAATVAGVALVATSLAPGERGLDPAGPAAPAAPLSWVDGSTLHEGAQTFDLGFRPVAYVRTSVGYVFADREGAVWSWQDGERSLAGSTDVRSPRLVADDETGLAGWVARDGSEYVVMDARTGTTRGYPAPTGTGPEDFTALDAGTGYWRDAGGASLVDLASGEAERVTGIARDADLGDLEEGRLATPDGQGVTVRTTGGAVLRELPEVYSDYGSLSQDGRYYTSDADQPEVYDVETGEKVTFDLAGREFATGYEWLGPRTLAVLAAARAEDSSRAELLVCEVPAGSCLPVAELGTFDEMVGRLLLPVGLPIDG